LEIKSQKLNQFPSHDYFDLDVLIRSYDLLAFIKIMKRLGLMLPINNFSWSIIWIKDEPNLAKKIDYDMHDMKLQLPPLLMMPVVENAFNHGVSETRDHLSHISKPSKPSALLLLNLVVKDN
jgi:hypothetical protein